MHVTKLFNKESIQDGEFVEAVVVVNEHDTADLEHRLMRPIEDVETIVLKIQPCCIKENAAEIFSETIRLTNM